MYVLALLHVCNGKSTCTYAMKWAFLDFSASRRFLFLAWQGDGKMRYMYVLSQLHVCNTPFPYGDSPLKRESAGQCLFSLFVRVNYLQIGQQPYYSLHFFQYTSSGLEFRGLWTQVQRALDWNLEPVKRNFRFGDNS